MLRGAIVFVIVCGLALLDARAASTQRVPPVEPGGFSASSATAGQSGGGSLLTSDDSALAGPTTDWGSAAVSGPVMEFGAELILMQLYIGSLSIGAIDGLTDQELRLTPLYSIQPAYRFWLGREAANGLGWRVSGWHFEASERLAFDDETDTALTTELDFYTVFLELTQRGSFAGWDLLASMGAAIAGVEDDFALTGETFPLSLDRRFDGGGVTFAVQVDRSIGSSPWELYGNFRASLLLGRTNFRLASRVPDVSEEVEIEEVGFAGSVNTQTVSVFQLGVGANRFWDTNYGLAFVRFGVEAQLWELPPVVFGLGDVNLGLFGPTFAVGLIR